MQYLGLLYNASLAGHFFDGIGAVSPEVLAQRQATKDARLAKQQAAKDARVAKQQTAKDARLAKQQANKVALANRKAAAKAKRQMKIAGKTVSTSNPAAAAKIQAAVTHAQNLVKDVTVKAAKARQTKSKADHKIALAAGQSAIKQMQSLLVTPTTATPAVKKAVKLRGMGYMGSCVDDGTGTGNLIDNGDGAGCDPTGGGGGYTPPANTGITPGFSLPPMSLPTFSPPSNAVRGCASGSNAPRCIIYQMAVDEQQQFQYVFSILQQMYSQLLTIVQQLMAQLQSAQQQPPAGAYPPPNPYTDPYGQYGGQPPYDQNNPYGQQPYPPQTPYTDPYGQQPQLPMAPQYGGQYQGPSMPQETQYAPAAPAPVPSGYDQGGTAVAARSVSPQQQAGGYPMMSPGGPPPQLVSSDSLPIGADQQANSGGTDDAAGVVSSYPSAPIQDAAAAVADATMQDTTGVSYDSQQDSDYQDQDMQVQGPYLYSGAGVSAGSADVRRDNPELYPSDQYLNPVISN